MNLSCGKCKTIQYFSGNPPKCDVCGWVCGTSTPLRKVKDGVAASVGFLMKIAAFWAVVAVIGYVLYLVFAPEQRKLSNEYNVPVDQVFVQAKPHGCDFADAPLGVKHCHYEKRVDVERACPGPDCRVTAVYVSWSKVSE